MELVIKLDSRLEFCFITRFMVCPVTVFLLITDYKAKYNYSNKQVNC